MLALAASAPAVEGDPEQVGVVTKVQNEAQIVSAAQATAAVIGTPVYLNDELRTGAEGRMRVTFRDGTVLTLGENASVKVDTYVFDPGRGVGETILQTTQGAFRFVTGRIKQIKDRKIEVVTPVAQLGVRGTEFWGGPIDEIYGVLLLEGQITVSNQAGSVMLSQPGQGTNIASPLDAPGSPFAWSAEKIARAVATVALH